MLVGCCKTDFLGSVAGTEDCKYYSALGVCAKIEGALAPARARPIIEGLAEIKTVEQSLVRCLH